MDTDNSNTIAVIEEFYSNFPFLELDKQLSNATIKFINTVHGNYSGEVKSVILQHEESPLEWKDNKSYDYSKDFIDKNTKNNVRDIRHGWGKMTWNNGTLYGSNLQFIYSSQDEYIGQWADNDQHG